MKKIIQIDPSRMSRAARKLRSACSVLPRPAGANHL